MPPWYEQKKLCNFLLRKSLVIMFDIWDEFKMRLKRERNKNSYP